MANIKDYLVNRDRIVLVGPNSQGKTYTLEQLSKDNDVKNNSIIVWSEIKADENLKNSADSTTLITWLNKLIDMTDLKELMDEKINTLDFSSINNNNNINVSLKNEIKSYKGLIGADITTTSNRWSKPGAGERFLGTLYLISKILEDNDDDTYKYLIMDEPERHLHPSLYIKMATILNKISKQGIKVIISTHSPVIVKYFTENTDEIIKMNDGDEIQLPDKQTLFEIYQQFNIYTEDVYKYRSFRKIETNLYLYFEKFIIPMIYDSLFCKTIIISEGYAEKEILELFFEKYRTDDTLNNLHAMVVYGKCFMPWIIVALKSIGIKVISIYDQDNMTDNKNLNLNNIIEAESDITKPIIDNIENLLGLADIDDKVKQLTIEIRSMFLNNDITLNVLLEEIRNLIDSDTVILEETVQITDELQHV